MKIHASVTVDRVVEAVQADEYLGFCVKCGEDQEGCEPDARKYDCHECGEQSEYGAEELLIYLVL